MSRKEKIFEEVEQLLTALGDSFNTQIDLVRIHSEYCGAMNYDDDYIIPMYELDQYMEGMTPKDIIKAVAGNDFDPDDDWFKVGIYGYESTNYATDWIDVEEIAKYVAETENYLGNGEIKLILDSIDFDEE